MTNQDKLEGRIEALQQKKEALRIRPLARSTNSNSRTFMKNGLQVMHCRPRNGKSNLRHFARRPSSTRRSPRDTWNRLRNLRTTSS